MKFGIIGYGKMGKAIKSKLIETDDQVIFTADNLQEIKQNLTKLKECDVVFEFSTPETAFDNIKLCIDNQVAVVSGTTGWINRLDEMKEYCIQNGGTLLYAPNFSIGMAIFMEVTARLSQLTANSKMYDVSISESHHIHKLDSPSGTAVKLKNIVQQNSNYDNIPIASIRKGEIIGDHSIIFSSEVDTIKFTHSAKNRDAFVLGAIFAAKKLSDKKGFIELKDIIK